MASNYISDLKAGRLQTFLGTASVVVDDPNKLRASPGEGPFHVGNKLYNTLLSARKEVLIFTPYFVPEDYGSDILEGLVARGLRVRIVTNSLASTNHAYVHGGYAPYRKRLLASGVEFLEVRADAPMIIDGSNSSLVLHSKLAIVDRKTLFVGSTNIDPRSIRQNTEVGLVINSMDLADNIQSRFEAVSSDYVFRVLRNPGGELEWVYEGSQGTETFKTEPGARSWNKFIAKMADLLPIENQL